MTRLRRLSITSRTEAFRRTDRDYGEYGGKLIVAEGETVGYIPSIIFTKDNVHDYEF